MWKSYEKFASQTELHGFDQVPRYGKLWAAVWLCLTVAACGMCVNDVINLAITYKSEPTVTQLVLKPNCDMTMPNPTLCMEVIVDSPSNITHPTAEIETDLQHFLSATNNAKKLDISYREDLNLSSNLQYYSYLMLSYIAEAELTYVGLNNKVLTSFVTNLANDRNWNNSTVNATIAYLYQRYLNENVSFANLKRLIGMDICQQRTGYLTRLNDTHNETGPICTPPTITHLSFSTVCSKLLENNDEELTHYSNIELSGTRVSLKDGGSSNQLFSLKFGSPSVTFAWHIDFQGRPMLPVGSQQDIFSWNPYYVRAFDLTVAAEYQFYNTKRDPCQTVEKQYNCHFKDKISQMQSKCGCRPSGLLYGDTDMSLPTCSENPTKPVWILSNVSDDNLQGNFTGSCGLQSVYDLTKSGCVRDCRLVTYLIEHSQPTKRLRLGLAETIFDQDWNPISISLPTGVLQFTVSMGKSRQLIGESPTKNFNTFICEFGGTIGAWLGASLLAFIHAVIHIAYSCCDVGKHLRGIKKKQSKNPNAIGC